MHRIATLGLHHDHVWSNLEQLVATGRAELASAEKGVALFEAAVSGVERFVQTLLTEPLPG